MTISQRAVATIEPPAEIPEHDRLLSEQFRIAAKEWCRLDGEARLLEADKECKLCQLMAELGDIPVSKAERIVKARPTWRDHVRLIVEARTEANLAKVRMQWVDLKFREWQSMNANARKETSMSTR